MKKILIIALLWPGLALGQATPFQQLKEDQGFQEDQQDVMQAQIIRRNKKVQEQLDGQQSQIDTLQAQSTNSVSHTPSFWSPSARDVSDSTSTLR